MSNKRKVGRPSAYDDVRGTITRASLSLFATKGFEATSVKDIAVQAGMPKANILYHFGNKDRLWKEAVDSLFADIDLFFVANLEQPLPADRTGLAQLIETFMLACCQYPAYVQIPAIEGNIASWRSEYLARKHVSRHVASTRGYLMALVDNRVVPPIEPLFLQTLMTGGAQLLLGQAELWREATGIDSRTEQFARRYASQITAVIAHG